MTTTEKHAWYENVYYETVFQGVKIKYRIPKCIACGMIDTKKEYPVYK